MKKDSTLDEFLVELADGTKVTIKHDDPKEERKHLKAVLVAKEARISREDSLRNLQFFPEEESENSLVRPDDLSNLITSYLEETANEVTHRTQTERIRALGMYTSLANTDQINQEGANEFSKMLRSSRLAPATINKRLALLGAFNTWLVNRGYAERNYFTNLKIKKVKQSHTERDPFTPEEIQTLLLDSTQVPTTTTEGFKYWLPRLGLYTGCRLNELCQLYMEDVTEVDGILSLKIQEGNKGQHLKNLSSKRIIPIHPDIAQEFKEYLKSVKHPSPVGHLLVFPGLTWTKSSHWSGKASNWFSRYRKTVGIDKPFHSLRHSFASNLQANSVDSRIIGELLGHAESGETGRYTGKRPVGQLLEAIETLKFD